MDDGNNGTIQSIKYGLIMIKRILWIFLICCIAYIVYKLVWTHNNGWSFFRNETEIKVECEAYDEGLSYWTQMDYEKAEEKLEEALALVKEERGSASLESAEVSTQLGMLYLESGKYEDSYEMLSNAYVIFRDKLGADDGKTILAKCQISVYDIQTDDAEQGFAALNEAFDETSYIGYKISICRMLAHCNTEIGNYDKAYKWYEILANLYNEFGISDQTGMELSNNFGNLLLEMGYYEKALDSFEGALSRWQAMGCDEDLNLSTIYLNLAKTHAFLGEYEKVKDYGEKSLEIRKHLFGEESVYVALAYDTLSTAYANFGEEDQRIALLNDALNAVREIVGDNHTVTALIYNDIGDYYYDHWDFNEAVNNHKKALEIRKNILGNDNIKTVAVYENLAFDYMEMEDYDNAKENAETALEICEDVYGKDSPQTVGAFDAVSKVYLLTNRVEEAMRYGETSIDICGRYFTKGNVTYAEALTTMGQICLASGACDDAMTRLNQALLIYDSFNNLKDAGKIHLYLGDVAVCKNDYQKASEEYKTAAETLVDYYDSDELWERILSERIEQLEQMEDVLDEDTLSWTNTLK